MERNQLKQTVLTLKWNNYSQSKECPDHCALQLGREEKEVEAALEKHVEIRKKWTHAVHTSAEVCEVF